MGASAVPDVKAPPALMLFKHVPNYMASPTEAAAILYLDFADVSQGREWLNSLFGKAREKANLQHDTCRPEAPWFVGVPKASTVRRRSCSAAGSVDF